MRKKLTNEEIYMIIRGEEECGVMNLILELHDNPNACVYCEIDEKGRYGKYEVK
jgi:hypothetical protein